MIIIMKTFGFRVNNDGFEKNSWYFRNALVRANYNNLQKAFLLQRNIWKCSWVSSCLTPPMS